jgi:hypothetical protein
MGEHYPFFVAWENLIEALAKVLNAPELKTNSTDKAYLCLRTLLGNIFCSSYFCLSLHSSSGAVTAATPYRDLTRDKPLMTVTCEAFGRFLDCFGPLIDEDKNIITKVRSSLSLSLSSVGWAAYV